MFRPISPLLLLPWLCKFSRPKKKEKKIDWQRNKKSVYNDFSGHKNSTWETGEWADQLIKEPHKQEGGGLQEVGPTQPYGETQWIGPIKFPMEPSHCTMGRPISQHASAQQSDENTHIFTPCCAQSGLPQGQFLCLPFYRSKMFAFSICPLCLGRFSLVLRAKQVVHLLNMIMYSACMIYRFGMPGGNEIYLKMKSHDVCYEFVDVLYLQHWSLNYCKYQIQECKKGQ